MNSRTSVYLLIFCMMSIPAWADNIQNLFKNDLSINMAVYSGEQKLSFYKLKIDNKLGDSLRLGEHNRTTGIGYVIHPRVILLAGYKDRVQDNPEYASDRRFKKRSFQELTLKGNKASFVAYGSRTRLEQRFINGEGDWILRLRQRFMIQWPGLSFDSKYMPVVYSELHFNLNHSDTDLVQNTFYIGLLKANNVRHSLQLGYKNKAKLDRKQTEHLIEMMFRMNMDLF